MNLILQVGRVVVLGRLLFSWNQITTCILRQNKKDTNISYYYILILLIKYSDMHR